jgi:ribose/xylose/arabinose/galactoside ABC-type transport system permease subunit
MPVLVMFALYVMFYFVLSRTLFGAHLYAMGGNTKAAWLSGLRVERIRIGAFVLAGLLAGLGGVCRWRGWERPRLRWAMSSCSPF